MTDSALNWLLDATFRANPRYELVQFDRLPPEHQQVLEGLRGDPDCYGILRPREAGLGVKSVNRDTAQLYLTLEEPGGLPADAKAMLGARPQTIAELVLDGVLEIEGASAAYVFGADAYPVMFGQPRVPTAETRIALLSIDALKYAQSLEISDSATLSARLYFYNRLPVTPRWKRTFPNSDAVAAYLGIEAGGSNGLLLEKYWMRTPSFVHDGWFTWQSRHHRDDPLQESDTYKLYVSPQCEAVRDAFQATVEVLTETQAPSFKIGIDAYGLLRPDKIVAYFAGFDELRDAADRLLSRLEGYPSHGVPFTAELGGGGLLSWGIDPPPPHHPVRGPERESWRLWVANQLARALIMAKAGGSSTMQPWLFAVERLRLHGVDMATWAPVETIFQLTARASE